MPATTYGSTIGASTTVNVGADSRSFLLTFFLPLRLAGGDAGPLVRWATSAAALTDAAPKYW